MTSRPQDIYQKKYGDLNIPAKYKTDEGFWLGRWWYLQKKLLRDEPGKLKPEQVEKLKEVLIGGAEESFAGECMKEKRGITRLS